MRHIVLGLLACSLLIGLGRPAEAATQANAQTLTIVVRVVDQNGAPIPGADVAFVWGSLITHYQADAQGIYTITGPAGPGGLTQYGICATYHRFGPDRRDACIGAITVPPGGTRVVDVVIDLSGNGRTGSAGAAPSTPGGRGWIHGTVSVVGGGAPTTGIMVALAGMPLTTRTAGDGSYQFPGLNTTDGANGGPTYTVRITPPPGYAVVGPASQMVTVQADHGVEADFTVQSAPCRFVLGFAALHSALPAVVGDCLGDEAHNPANGDALQHTTRGLLVWRKADNFTAFTDGYRTWVNGPSGVQERLNSQRFPWEANPDGLPVVR